MLRVGGEMVPHVYPAEPLLGWMNQRAGAGVRSPRTTADEAGLPDR